MRKKRIMIVGPRNCGKTTLANRLNDYAGPLRKTQDTIYGEHTIDIPSAYLENTDMYKHLIALSQDAWCVLMLIDQKIPAEVYSHAFANALLCPAFGVISNSDSAQKNREKCIRQLSAAGAAGPYFEIDLSTDKGINELKEFLKTQKLIMKGTGA